MSGGWNRQLSDVSTFDNVVDVKRALLMEGFSENNIVTFYANGHGPSSNKDVNQDETSFKNLADSDDVSGEYFHYPRVIRLENVGDS